MRTISLLEVLSTPERTRFGKYLKSPFFTNKSHLYPLFLELRDAEPSVAQNPTKCFSKVFLGELFDRHKWNKALSDLNACIEDFLAISHLQANQDLYHQALVSACAEHLNEPVLRRVVGAVLDQLPSSSEALEQVDRWHLRFWSRKQVLTHPATNRMKLGETALDALERDLDTYYFINKTQIICNRVSGIRFLNWTGTLDASQQWLEIVRIAASERSSLLLKAYCEVLRLLLDSNFALSEFFVTLRLYGPCLHPDELRDIVRLVFNECIHRQRNGDGEVFHWHLEIYLWSNEQGLWTASKGEELYLNIGVLLIKANMPIEFNQHLSVGREIITTERSEQAKILLQACWEHYRGNYAEAQILLGFVDSRHPRYALLRHSIAVRNAYMLWQRDELDLDMVQHALGGFDDFLRYQKLFSKSFCQSYKNLIWFVRKFLQNDPNRKFDKAWLQQEVKNRRPAASEWVKATLDNLPD